jgi:hypothetical protein
LALALVATAQIAWAQTTPPKKKKKPPAPPPEAEVEVPETPPPPPPPPVVNVAPDVGIIHVEASTPGQVYIDGVEAGPTPADVHDVRPGKHRVRVKFSEGASDNQIVVVTSGETARVEAKEHVYESDVFEKSGQRYFFIGLRYRGTIIPKAFENLFVSGGATIYSNSIGVEADIRKDGFSLIPAISYTSYGTGNILFLQKNEPDVASNWSLVNSSLGAIYLTADLMWSVHLASTVDFEVGAGFGLGFLFGSLENNWVTNNNVTANTPGALPGDNGVYYVACKTTSDGTGCAPGDHTNPNPVKVGGYNEPFWTGGGSVPNVFPHISIPQIGLRFKPIKQLEGRIGVGFSITGIWFGASADYGFETPEKK